MKTLAKLETRALRSPVKTDSQYRSKTLALPTRSQSTRGTLSSQGSIPTSASNDSYATYILNSLQDPQPWSSPKTQTHRRANSEESKTRHREEKAAPRPPGARGPTPPPVRREKRRKVRHYRDRTLESSESDSTDLGSWSDSSGESSSDF
nr:MAG: ORF3 [Torque teno polar bear virus 34]